MPYVLQRGLIIELTDINNNTLRGRIIDFRLNHLDGKYRTFMYLEEIESGNTMSEHYGLASIAIDDVKDVEICMDL